MVLPIRYLLGDEQRRWLDGVDLVVPSPGVAAENPLLQEANRRGNKILAEIEIAYRFFPTPLVGITGTNGKSTTTTLVGGMLKANGTKVFVGGNIGAPLIGFVGGDWDWGVVEISSFQLEWIEAFRPRVAVLLNLSEDHLDRYPASRLLPRKERDLRRRQRHRGSQPRHQSCGLRRRPARIISFGFSEVDDGARRRKFSGVTVPRGKDSRCA
jgi:UDP-N-acetylmuramate-alanine ligase